MRTILFLLLLASFTAIQAQELDPVKWTFDINQIGPKDYQLFFQAELDQAWNVYSQYTEEGGPIPTSISYTSANVEYEGMAVESGDKKEGMDEMFGMNVIKYSYKEPFRMKHNVKVTDISKPVTGYITYMTCNDSMCLPPKDVEFSFTIKVVNPLDGGQ